MDSIADSDMSLSKGYLDQSIIDVFARQILVARMAFAERLQQTNEVSPVLFGSRQ